MKRIKMKRSAQLGIGFCVILASLTFLGLTQGWYFSSQICTEDSLRGLYFDPEEKIAEVQVGNKRIYLYTNQEQDKIAVMGAQRKGFVYEPFGGFTNIVMNSEEAYDLQMVENDGIYIAVIVRRDPCVARVEAQLNNGLTWIAEQWHDDFALIALEIPEASVSCWPGIYRALDKDGRVLMERTVLG